MNKREKILESAWKYLELPIIWKIQLDMIWSRNTLKNHSFAMEIEEIEQWFPDNGFDNIKIKPIPEQKPAPVYELWGPRQELLIYIIDYYDIDKFEPLETWGSYIDVWMGDE